MASNNEESEMKAEAAREGVMVADTQAAALAKETTSLRWGLLEILTWGWGQEGGRKGEEINTL